MENDQRVLFPILNNQPNDANSESTSYKSNEMQLLPVSQTKPTHLKASEFRRAPEGEDNESTNDKNQVLENTNEKMCTTDVNGKVTVHVVVTINGNGTLADLKKQRMQIRNSTSDITPVCSPEGSEENDNFNPITSDIVRFSGNTTEENVDYIKPKRCCNIQ